MLIGTLAPFVVNAQENNEKPKKKDSTKQSAQVVDDNTIDQSTAVPVTSTKSSTPVEVEINAVEEKPRKTDNPKN